jgi:hypothetical protein
MIILERWLGTSFANGYPVAWHVARERRALTASSKLGKVMQLLAFDTFECYQKNSQFTHFLSHIYATASSRRSRDRQTSRQGRND